MDWPAAVATHEERSPWIPHSTPQALHWTPFDCWERWSSVQHPEDGDARYVTSDLAPPLEPGA